ncbi:MAG TPA: serine recombinase, partial [Acetobacteraceae bacterium]|nr:serine recombinase [Acetobacteraceae bacterium]
MTASGEDLTATDDPARVAMRQVAGAFAEFEKARLVHKLRGARDRASEAAGWRVEGRKPTLVGGPEVGELGQVAARRHQGTKAVPSRRPYPRP